MAAKSPAFKGMPYTPTFDIEGSGWVQVPHRDFMAVFKDNARGLSVIVSMSDKAYPDKKRWLHVSVAGHRGEVPSYEILTEVKRRFIGAGKKAIMVLPDEKYHVNIHPDCLHLWCCLDGDGLPEFSGMLPGLGRSI